MRLAGKVALITGAGSGMGRVAALQFAREGARVVAADLDAQAGQETESLARADGLDVRFTPADVSREADCQAMVAFAEDTFGGLHVLYNNAGIFPEADHSVTDTDEAVWDRVLAVNVKGVYLACKYGIPAMLRSGGGSIVNIGSVGGLSGTFSTAYSSSKWALEGLSRSAAYIYADWGIRCNVIQPGFIKTKMTAPMQSNPALKAVVDQQMNDTVLLRRMGEPEEIANTALFLASDESSYITGTDIVVDGGWFSAAAYLTNERRNHMLDMMQQAKK